MAFIKTTRITLVVGLLIAGAVLAWLAAHPRIYAGQLGRLVTSNLLQGTGANFSFRDFDGNLLEHAIFRDVSLTRAGDDGSFLYVSAESLAVTYHARTLLRGEPILKEVVIGGARVLLRQGAPNDEPDSGPHWATTVGALPALQIDRLSLNGLDFRLTASDGTTEQEVTGLQAEMSVAPDDTALAVELALLRGRWPSQSIHAHHARGSVRIAPPIFEFDGFDARLDSTRAHVDMILGFEADGQAWFDLTGVADQFLLSELMHLIMKEESEVPRLLWSGNAHVALQRGVMRIEGDGAGWLDDAPVTAREFVGVIEGEDITFERAIGTYRSAQGDVTGFLDGDPDPPRLELRGRVRGANLQDRWTGEDLDWPTSDFAAGVWIALDLEEVPSIEIHLDEIEGEIATLPVDSGRVRIRWREADGLSVDQAVVHSMGARLEAEGGVSPGGVADLFVRAEAGPLERWAERAELPLNGRGLVGAGRLVGPIDSLTLEAAGTVDRVQVERLEARDGRLSIRMPRVDLPDQLWLSFFALELAVDDRVLGELDFELDRSYPVNAVPRLTLSSADSSLTLSGRVIEQPDSTTFTIEFDSLQFAMAEDIWTLPEPGSFDVGATHFATEGLELSSETGRFVIVGGFDRIGDLDLQLQVLEGDLSILDRAGLVPGIGGDLSGAMQLSGRADDPSVVAIVEVDSLRIGARSVDRIAVVGEASGGSIHLQDVQVQTTAGRARAQGQIELPIDDWMGELRRDPSAAERLWSASEIDVGIRTDDLDLEPWLDPSAAGGLYGRIDATLQLSGSTRVPRIEGQVEVHGFPADPFVLPYMSAEVVTDSLGLRVREGRVDLGGPDATVTLSLPLFVSLTGPTRFDEEAGFAAELSTQGEVDFSTLTALWPQIRSVGGRGDLHMIASGNPRTPILTGALSIRDGEFALEGWAEELRDVEVDGHFEGAHLILDRIDAREGLRGRARGTGDVEFRGLLPDDVSLDLRASRVLLASVPFLRAVGSSDDLKLRLERPSPDSPRAPKITGTIVVDKALYTGAFVAEGAEVDPALLPTSSPLWMVDLTIDAQEQVRISNQSAELRVVGNVDLVRDTAGLRLRGTVEIPQGRVPLFNNDFTITEGTLDFSRRPLEPEVDIRAQTEVPIYDPTGNFGRELERITIHLTGTFAQPTVQFESENGLDETTILRILAGFSATDTEATVGIGDVGLRAGLNFLERALAQQIRGVDTIDIQTEEAGLDQMQGTRIAVGKYLSDSLYMRFSQGLSVTERDLFLEYQITRRTLLTSELKRRLRESGAENEFNLDLKFRVKY